MMNTWRSAAVVLLVGLLGACAAPLVQTLPPRDEAPTATAAAPAAAAPAAAAAAPTSAAADPLLPDPLDCDDWRYDGLTTTQPAEWEDNEYRFGSFRDPSTRRSPQRLCGQVGAAADLAWTLERGRSDVVISVLDSGIEWRNAEKMPDLVNQTYLNRGELPRPRPAATGPDPYDTNGDGRFTVSDYSADPRVTDRNASGYLDPEDLILTPSFNNGVDSDANGYVDDISGWDFLNNDNNPLDDVDYGHGSGEARDAVGAHDGQNGYGTCPGCLALHVRVADSFIAEGGRFAAGVLFSVDAGADVVLDALGAISNPGQAQAAVSAAYYRGVPIMASMADEQSQHANLPAAMNHTIPVNSITELPGLTEVAAVVGGRRESQLLNGCTNYGGIAWVSVPSTGCSSEATGNVAGMMGVIQSAARSSRLAPHPDLVARGVVGPGRNVLSANEAAQLLRAGADDIDFATPNSVDGPNQYRDEFGQSRFPTVRGWDATHGYGQVNLYESVRDVLDGNIPPEADVTSPELFEVLPTTGSVPVVGRVAAMRARSYSYRVEWTTGLQTDRHPAVDDWRVVTEQTGLTRPRDGVLANLDLAQIAAALPEGATGTPSGRNGRPEPDRFSVRIRVVVTDDQGRVGTMHRHLHVHDDPDLVTSREYTGAGTSSPVFADLDRDGDDEIILAGDDGVVRALRADGTSLPGWPARTPPAPYWPTKSPTVTADRIPTPGRAISVGAPAVADLDNDGSPEVVVTDLDGTISVIGANGKVKARPRTDPNYSRPSATDQRNRLKRGFMGGAALGDLDGDGDLEIVAAAQDRHLYAFHHNGTPVAGFPVLLVDPTKISAVDPVTDKVTFANPGFTGQGGEIVATPALGDLDRDGLVDIVVGVQEQYTEPIEVVPPIGAGNSRLYAVSSRGTLNPRGVDRSAAHPDDRAYLRGWPVKVPMVILQILPAIGQGVATQAAIGDVDGDGAPEVVANSASGQFRVWDADGTNNYAKPLGLPVALNWLFATPSGTNAPDSDLIIGAFSGPAIGNLGSWRGKDIAGATGGVGRAIDALAPNQQIPSNPSMTVWSGADGGIRPGFPRLTADLAFFVTPAIADVSGDGANEVVAGNGMHLLDAFNPKGGQPAGWPKLTGGWVVGTPGFGDWDGDGTAEVAVVRRDGRLMVWALPTPADRIGDWVRFGGNDRNTGSVP